LIKIIKNNYKFYYNLLYVYDKLMEFYYEKLSTPEKTIKKRYKKRLGKKVDLTEQIVFNDKIQWLKLNWYDPFATICADKYKVRDVIKQTVGEKYLNEQIAVFENVNEIDIEKLHKSFVLKGTHGSGFNIVCRDKTKMKWDLEFRKMKRWLSNKYYLKNGEWVYKDIKPRIICEKYMDDENQHDGLTDYKFYCFHGEPMYCQVIKDREAEGTIDFFDMNWNHMEFTGLQKLPHSKEKIEKPLKLNEMYNIAEKLSKRFPFVRVDFYYVNNKVYFGEITFFPRSGFGDFQPEEWNERIGALIKLEKINKKRE